MKTTWKLILMLAVLVPFITLSGCKKDNEEEAVPAFETLSAYMKTNKLDLSDILLYTDEAGTQYNFVVGAPATDADVATFAAKYYIMDLRSAADFATGHITGAKNVAFANILTEAAKADKQILMVCYTGQTACYATSLLRMYGYPKTQALKWGMSGWNASFDKYTAGVGSPAQGNANWTTEAAPANVTYAAPKLSAKATDGAAILKERVEAIVAEGTKTVKGSDLLAAPTAYFINNYFSQADYTAYGHIKGAYRVNPLLLSDNTMLNLNPDMKVAVYCYTGQTSSMIAPYLRVLGYDAYSTLFGMNGLYNSSTAWGTSVNQWGVGAKPKSLSTVTN